MQGSMLPLRAQDEPDDSGVTDEEILAGEEVDAAVEDAKTALRQWFSDHSEEVFYQQQLEVIFERDYFHWVTRRALRELVAETRLVLETVPLAGAIPLHVFRRPSNRNWRRKANALVQMVTEFSPGTPLGSSLGQHGELMFDSALARFGFIPVAREVREWDGRQWTASGHDLDRVYRRDGVDYGAEIKNTLKYMPRAEFGVKLEMCRALGLRPLFITRAAPKTYNYRVIQSGGYAMVFRYQLYPAGFSDIARRVRDELYLPVDSPAAISDGTVQRLVNWHDKNR
jgi:hypothetical protein